MTTAPHLVLLGSFKDVLFILLLCFELKVADTTCRFLTYFTTFLALLYRVCIVRKSMISPRGRLSPKGCTAYWHYVRVGLCLFNYGPGCFHVCCIVCDNCKYFVRSKLSDDVFQLTSYVFASVPFVFSVRVLKKHWLWCWDNVVDNTFSANIGPPIRNHRNTVSIFYYLIYLISFTLIKFKIWKTTLKFWKQQSIVNQ